MATNTPLPSNNNNLNVSPEAAQAANNGTATNAPTPGQLGSSLSTTMAGNNASPLVTGYSPYSQQLNAPSQAAFDTTGSKLVESLQGARKTALDETSNRLAAQGITGGQAASQLSKADRDYAYGMSQGLGQFNLQRLSQAAGINRDFLQLELQRQLGLGQLDLGSRELDNQIAISLAQMAQNADTQTRNEIMNLMNTYFGE